ncbi:hypothetical protein ALC60_01039 [Trachymyrmex zeteki]|uniref:Uncharacterized protein n=1 Tax=Mycetomoellerius zeteki TaxID=64791 RepID=A0A151XHR3_9HYME|nr:hypothetical protein ALC60_01039 [Trachymyrmex zeteki]
MQDAVIFESRTLVRPFLGVFGTEVIRSFSRDINANYGGSSSYATGPAASALRRRLRRPVCSLLSSFVAEETKGAYAPCGCRYRAESCEAISGVVVRRGDFNNAPVRAASKRATLHRGLKTHVQELFRRRKAEERHGTTTYFSSPRTLIGRFTNYKAQGGQRTLAGMLAVVSINMPAFALSLFIRLNVNDAKRMLSPGQDAPPSNYSSGNVVLQGAPCGQCRDLCPAGYVPHFWRTPRRERVKTSRAVLRLKSTSREDLKVFKFLSNSHAKAATGSDILLSGTTTIVAQLRSEIRAVAVI